MRDVQLSLIGDDSAVPEGMLVRNRVHANTARVLQCGERCCAVFE